MTTPRTPAKACFESGLRSGAGSGTSEAFSRMCSRHHECQFTASGLSSPRALRRAQPLRTRGCAR
ncbi:hypothetical protein FDZ84_27280 [Saccharopolyspora sp. ASAGF58]|nr:hypothetical protein FDZ84_27280 [Saccharopolyspora sp. ASAGF58]